MAVFKVDAFLPIEEFKRETEALAKYLKSSQPAQGFDRIYYPGELEYLKTQKLLKEGIDVETATWDQLRGLAEEYGLISRLHLE